jgi:hypothetical protein
MVDAPVEAGGARVGGEAGSAWLVGACGGAAALGGKGVGLPLARCRPGEAALIFMRGATRGVSASIGLLAGLCGLAGRAQGGRRRHPGGGRHGVRGVVRVVSFSRRAPLPEDGEKGLKKPGG